MVASHMLVMCPTPFERSHLLRLLNEASFGEGFQCIGECILTQFVFSSNTLKIHNHNFLGCKQPSGLYVKQSPNAQNVFWPMQGLTAVLGALHQICRLSSICPLHITHFSVFFLLLHVYHISHLSLPLYTPPPPPLSPRLSLVSVLNFKDLHQMSKVLSEAGLPSDAAFTIREHFTPTPGAKSLKEVRDTVCEC